MPIPISAITATEAVLKTVVDKSSRPTDDPVDESMDRCTVSTIATKKAIAVFVAEKQQLTAWCLNRLIQSTSDHMDVIGMAHSYEQMNIHPSLPNADVVLINMNITDSNIHLEHAITTLRGRTAARILVLASAPKISEQIRMITLGVQGFLHENADTDVIIKAITKLHEGQFWMDRKSTQSILQQLITLTPDTREGMGTNPRKSGISFLTEREREVIRLMCQRVELKQFAIAIELGINENTLRNYLTAIYKKLEIRGRLELYDYATNNNLHS